MKNTKDILIERQAQIRAKELVEKVLEKNMLKAYKAGQVQVLKDECKLTYREIAERLDISNESAVRSLYNFKNKTKHC